MGKGDTLRPVNKEKYDASFDRVFGVRGPKVWKNPPRYTDRGELISGSGDAVEQDDGGPPDPPAPEEVEGKGCSVCRRTRKGEHCAWCGRRLS